MGRGYGSASGSGGAAVRLQRALCTHAYRVAPAVEIARADLQKRVVLEALGTTVRALLDYEGPEAKQFQRQIDGVYRPVWRVLIRPNMRDHWHYFVDAVDGRVVEAYNNTQTEGPRTGRGVDLKGAVQTFNVY